MGRHGRAMRTRTLLAISERPQGNPNISRTAGTAQRGRAQRLRGKATRRAWNETLSVAMGTFKPFSFPTMNWRGRRIAQPCKWGLMTARSK
eukprot:1466637-Pyramimonas_sp.AAC.1